MAFCLDKKSLMSHIADEQFSPTHLGLNTLSIAEMTGIPRETVRRRLKLLVANELIVPGPNKTYSLNDVTEIIGHLTPIMRLSTPA